MKLRFFTFIAVISLFTAAIFGQSNTFVGQVTNSPAETFAGAISGDGRFIVFESRGNIATENPRNADNNVEIFLFDYAQRRIFQITDTKSVLFNPFTTASFSNTRVEITNRRPVISNDGRWIAFSSNATTSTPAAPDATNPGSFDGNVYTIPPPTPPPTPVPGATPTPTPSPTPTPTPGQNILTQDANLEMWLYQIPAYGVVADLSAGDEIPLTDLAGGTFTRITNTPPSLLPTPGTATLGPFVADDNHDASINDDGSVIAFGSTRALTADEAAAQQGNDEIFVYIRTAGVIKQVTATERGPIFNPIYSKNVSVSGTGGHLAFASTGDNPVLGPDCTGGVNPLESRNEEIFYVILDPTGTPTSCRQVTETTPTNPGNPINILDLGKRISRDGRFIAFDSYANLAEESGVTDQTTFATYVFDAAIADPANPFRRIGPRSNADSAAAGGDVQRYPGFTDYDLNGTPATLVFQSRLNMKPDGTIPATAADGQNPDATRPTQIYSYALNVPPATATFERLTKFPALTTSILPSTQPLPSNTSVRLAFNLAISELGTGNPDFLSETYYLLNPAVASESEVDLNFFTGASRRTISMTAVPTPSPTPVPSPTPTPSPGSTPLPTPTPVTPPAVFGFSPGSQVIMAFEEAQPQPTVPRTAIGSLSRRFPLPIELSGVRVSINGVAAGMKSVTQNEIIFVAPQFIASQNSGTKYPIVINNNGIEIVDEVTIVPTQPDVFSTQPVPGPGGRADALNVVNRVHTREPFTVRTVQLRGGKMVPTRLRLRMTGIANTTRENIAEIRIGGTRITGTPILTGGVLVEPGVYTVDFLIPPALAGQLDQPIIVTVLSAGVTFTTRLDDTAPKLSFVD